MSFPFSAALFDLDGTLVDSASDIAEAVNRLLDDEGLARVDEPLIRTWIGEGAPALLEAALRHAGSARPVEELMSRFMVHYGDCLLLQPRLYPGVAETLDALAAMQVPLAVCTNKPEAYAAPLIEHMGIADRFQSVVAAGTLSERKPHPLPLLHLADALGAAPGNCLMVGDSETDFLAAQAAGMPVVLVSYGYKRHFDLHTAGALAVIDRFEDLLALPASAT